MPDSQKIPDVRWLSVADAAAYLRVSQQTIRATIRRGDIKLYGAH